jgi:O-acetyl-ADP-ribose deacetylase (regulator of RNase III)
MRQPEPSASQIDALVADLRELRLHGLLKLRRLHLAELERAVERSLEQTAEALLRAAVDALGPGTLGQAAGFTLGLAQGTRDWPAQDRRRRAAEVYGVSVERFRKHHEHLVIEQIAEQVLLRAGATEQLNREGASVAPQSDREHATPQGAAESATHSSTLLAFRDRGATTTVAVHPRPMELLHDVDVHVSPSNVYFETPRVYGDSVAGGLRRAAGRRDAAGRITDDVLQRELATWVASQGGPGTAFQAGSVARTSPGALSDRGIRRIYHVATAIPDGFGGYRVDEPAVAQAVHGVFAAARHERDQYHPPLASICFPLIGAGRGGLRPEESINALWWALREELGRGPGWTIHLALKPPELAGLVLRHLLREGAQRL